METRFRDRMLTCDACGNEFVFTIGQQRQAMEQGNEVVDPSHCPVCAVRLERGGTPQRSAETERQESTRNGNGYHDHESDWSSEPEPQLETNDTPASSYRSGREHPLYGRAGEVHEGEVKWFNDRKGFGFITLDSGIEIFVHYSGIVGEGYRSLQQGQRVRITVEDTDKGPQASNVTALDTDTFPAVQ